MRLSHALLCLCVLLVSPSLALGANAQEAAHASLTERNSFPASTLEGSEGIAGPRGLHYWRLPRSSHARHLHRRRLGIMPEEEELAARAEPELKFLDKKPWGRRSHFDSDNTVGAEPLGLASGEGGRLNRRVRPDWRGDTPENRRPGWRADWTPPGNSEP